MAMINVYEMLGKSMKSGLRIGKENSIVFSSYKTSSDRLYSMGFNISLDIIKMAGLQKGDYINFLYDPDTREGLIVKTDPKKGWRLSGHSQSSLLVKASWFPCAPSCMISSNCEFLSVAKNEIRFKFGDDVVFTERHAREGEQA